MQFPPSNLTVQRPIARAASFPSTLRQPDSSLQQLSSIDFSMDLTISKPATRRHFFSLFLCFISLLSGTGQAGDRWLLDDEKVATKKNLTPAQVKFFETKIRPVLVNQCYSCHSAEAGKVKGGLALDTRQGIRKGGDTGHGIFPGDVEESLVLSAIKYDSFEMPPKNQLPAKVIRDFEQWVKMGAPDPRGGQTVAKNRATIDFAAAREFWAFQSPKKLDPPKVKGASKDATPIDLFIEAKLQEADLKPLETAGEQQLLRRDYLNLIGLPPTPKQMVEYQRDRDPKKREKLIDRLLDSPQFGERWGRHWLDVARFAESNGRERNFLFPHAWRFRDYVIDSFNADKSYQRMIREQIAGDLIQPLSGQPDTELKIATGFLAIGPKLLNERNREVFAMDMVDEQIDVVCRSTMALTVACARCHDHKFDPISTKDYYAVAGIFRSTQTLFGSGGNGSRQSTRLIDVSTDAGQSKELAAKHQAEIQKLAQQVKNLNSQIRSKQQELKKGAGGKKKKQGKNKNAANSKALQREINSLRKRLRNVQQKLKRLRADGPAASDVAMGATDGNGVNCNVLIRGEVTAKGPKVDRGFLTVLSPDKRFEVENDDRSGRLDLANWITSEENPLTARVAVNRVWRHLFGEGLVRTVDNFGETGERPSHPELLDYLAIRFMENGWSFKKIIREIMLTETYERSSGFHDANYERDPDNRLLWRMNSRRLDAEVLRDSILFAAGRLELKRPVASVVAKYKSSQGVGRGVTEATFNIDSPHRSVYLPVVRNAIPEPLRVFDFAEPSILVGDRQVTTVPTQALFLLNSDFVIQNSRLLAESVSEPGSTTNDQIKSAFRRVLSREPATDEVERAEQFLRSAQEKLLNASRKKAESKVLALTAFCQALFASGEFRILN